MVQPRPLRRLPRTTIGILSLLTATTVLATQKNCQDIQQKSGAGPYQKCLADNQEDTWKQQVAIYKDSVTRQRQAVKAYYDALINQENFAWKDIDLRLETEKTNRGYHLKQLETAKGDAGQIQSEKNALALLQKIRSLTSTSHNQKLRRLKLRQDAELHELDAAPTTYELQLKQQGMPAY